MTRIGLEHTEQSYVIAWARIHEHEYPGLDLLHSIPSGAAEQIYEGQYINKHGKIANKWRPNVSQINKLKAEGLKPGFPDLHLPVARCGYHALFIEMKRPDNKGRVSDDQKRILDRLHEEGNLAIVCLNGDEAIEALTEYLEGKLPLKP